MVALDFERSVVTCWANWYESTVIAAQKEGKDWLKPLPLLLCFAQSLLWQHAGGDVTKKYAEITTDEEGQDERRIQRSDLGLWAKQS